MEPPGPQTFFGPHAKDYRVNPSHARGPDLAALVEELKPQEGELALDVGTGTGHTALAIAALVGHVVGMDATREMLVEARDIARERGIRNLSLTIGNAQRLEFRDQTFDLVTTRRAVHHFPEPRTFLAEAQRVLKPGGRLGIVDMCPSPGDGELQNTIERIRDPTHRRGLPENEWRRALSGQGFSIHVARTLREFVPLDAWLRPVASGGKEEDDIRRAIDRATPEARRALDVREKDGRVEGFVKQRIVLVAFA